MLKLNASYSKPKPSVFFCFCVEIIVDSVYITSTGVRNNEKYYQLRLQF